MAGLANLIEDYRNWNGRQKWNVGREMDILSGYSSNPLEFDDATAFGPGNLNVAGLAGMVRRINRKGLRDQIHRILTEGSDAPVQIEPLHQDVWDAIVKSRELNNQQPIQENNPSLLPKFIDKMGRKRMGEDGLSPDETSGLVNSLLYGSRTKAAGSLKRDGESTALINSRDPNSHIGFVRPSEDGGLEIETAYKVKTPRLPKKLGR